MCEWIMFNIVHVHYTSIYGFLLKAIRKKESNMRSS